MLVPVDGHYEPLPERHGGDQETAIEVFVLRG